MNGSGKRIKYADFEQVNPPQRGFRRRLGRREDARSILGGNHEQCGMLAPALL